MKKKIINPKALLCLFVLLCIVIISVTGQSGSGRIKIAFYHEIDGQPIEYNSAQYINEKQETYEVDELQYFISDIFLHIKDGQNLALSPDKPFHYVDNNILMTLSWELPQNLPAGIYDSVSFTFGLDSSNNKSFSLIDSPENLMFWPDELGGGYHHMKLNIKYSVNGTNLKNFNCHLGTGQLLDDNGEAIAYIPNDFRVSVPIHLDHDTINRPIDIALIMNIANWFRAPNEIDFDDYNTGIMANQEAMKLFCENGQHVFSIRIK
jgi:hypothetical protein